MDAFSGCGNVSVIFGMEDFEIILCLNSSPEKLQNIKVNGFIYNDLQKLEFI